MRFGTRVPCTFIKDHPAPNHSWFALKVQDEVDNEMAAQGKYNLSLTIPDDLVPLIAAITGGSLDDGLEVILTAAHGRKRALHQRGRGISTERRNN